MQDIFTVGMVNYKTSVYMETQFKIFKEFSGESFEFIILDNTQDPKELDILNDLIAKYQIKAQVIPHISKNNYGSAQHGEGLQIIYDLVQTKYFLAQDPDFFWTKPNFLTFLKEKLVKVVAVGATGTHRSHLSFPGAPGCAYTTALLKVISANFNIGMLMGGPNNGDVGWYIEDKLKNLPYLTLPFNFQPTSIGQASFILNGGCNRYTLESETIAYHISRGSFEHPVDRSLSLADRLRKPVPEEWVLNRKKYCDFFYQEILAASK